MVVSETVLYRSGRSDEPLEAWSGESSTDLGAGLSSRTLRLWRAFAPLPLDQRRWALAVGVIETVRAGSRHVASGDEVVVITSGCVATLAVGSDLAMEILKPGDVLASGDHQATAGLWVTDGEVYRVSLRDWLARAGSEGVTHLLDAGGRRRVGLERRILCANLHLATARVADLIRSIHLIDASLNVRLSQDQLAAMLGLRRTTVNNACQVLSAAGATRTGRCRVQVLDAQKLSAAACACGASRD